MCMCLYVHALFEILSGRGWGAGAPLTYTRLIQSQWEVQAKIRIEYINPLDRKEEGAVIRVCPLL